MGNSELESLRHTLLLISDTIDGLKFMIGFATTAIGICITLAAWGIASAIVSLEKKGTDRK